MEKKTTVGDLIKTGFKGKFPVIIKLSMENSVIPVNSAQQEILKKAIANKDYYEIKMIVSKLKKPI